MNSSTLAVLLRPLGRLGIPGWFPLVVERAHRRTAVPEIPLTLRLDGVVMRLDLHEYVQRRVFYAAYERAELAVMRRLLRPGDTMVDVGANVGFFTLRAALAVGPAGRVHAIEPVPANLAALRRNVELNAFENVTIEPVAVAATAATLVLGLDDHQDPALAAGRDGTSGNYAEGGGGCQVEVPALPLDDILDRVASDEPIRLLKIDVEGGEPAALAGMGRRLRHEPPDAVFMEINPGALHAHGSSAGAVTAPLANAGYELLRIGFSGRTARFDPSASPRAGVLNVIALQPGVCL